MSNTATPWDRRFRWISSATEGLPDLGHLEQRMAEFYARTETRRAYQAMLDDEAHRQPRTEAALLSAVIARRPGQVLEVGCADGRLYRDLRGRGYQGTYTGVDLAADVIDRNRERHPDATWIGGAIQRVALAPDRFDVVFAYFVIEHCVSPADALERMVRLTRPGGAVLLVFPDFARMGRFASQAIGRRRGQAREHLKRGAVLDVLVGLFDSRLRLPRALRQAPARHGPFPVNLNPRCLFDPGWLEPDVDAVYIASAAEIERWARERHLGVGFPAGRRGHFRENAFMEIRRPDPAGPPQ